MQTSTILKSGLLCLVCSPYCLAQSQNTKTSASAPAAVATTQAADKITVTEDDNALIELLATDMLQNPHLKKEIAIHNDKHISSAPQMLVMPESQGMWEKS